MAAQRPDALDAASRPSAVGGGIARRPNARAWVCGLADESGQLSAFAHHRQLASTGFDFGGADLQSEELIAYEIGYRAQVAERLSVDAAVFYNDYDQVIGAAYGTPFPERRIFPPHLVLPVELQNVGSGYNTGFELAADWRPMQDWRLRLAYSYLYSDIENRDGEPIYNHGNQNRISLFSSWKLRDDLELDVWWRYVDNDFINTISTGRTELDSYSTVDLRLGWRPRKDLELSLVGANLFGGVTWSSCRKRWRSRSKSNPAFTGN
jgi:outer membrane receptor protein involved in Fe transport